MTVVIPALVNKVTDRGWTTGIRFTVGRILFVSTPLLTLGSTSLFSNEKVYLFIGD
jgi:hypothetical protein